MDDVSQSLDEAVPPWWRQLLGHHEGERGVGVLGGVVLLDEGTQAGCSVTLEGVRELAAHQPTEETWGLHTARK